MYPTLSEMGITSPAEISSYELFEDVGDEDVLRIRYRRKSGSLLPEIRVYRFRRIGVPGGAAASGSSTEISPKLSQAILELDELLSARGEVSSLAAQINDALDAVEMELGRVRSLTRKMKESSGA